MKALVVGFGKMGMLHAAILNSLPEIDETVVCEPSSFIREGAMAFHPRLKFYADIEEAFRRSTIDLAVISTPNKTHFEIFKSLCSRNIHLFIEKPFVTSAQEAEQALVLYGERGGQRPRIMVGYCLRFQPSFELAQAILSKNVLGSLSHFEAKMFSSDVTAPQKGWRFEKSDPGGGAVMDLGSHVVDMLRSFFGRPRRIHGIMETRISKNVEDYCFAQFDYQKFSGSLEVSWSVPDIRKPQVEIMITGSNGTLTVSNDSVEFDLTCERSGYARGHHAIDMTELAKPVPFDLGGPFYTRQLMEWIEAIRTGKPHRNGLLESVENHQLLDAIRSSSGQWIDLNLTGANGSSDIG